MLTESIVQLTNKISKLTQSLAHNNEETAEKTNSYEAFYDQKSVEVII